MSPRRAPRASLLTALALTPALYADDRELFVREVGAPREPAVGAVVPAATAAADDGAATEAEAALARAERLFLASSFAEAADGLRAAERRVAPALLDRRRALLVRLELWSGVCALLAADEAEARGAFGRALALDPDAALDRGVFSPEVQSAFERAAQDHHAAARATRTLTTEPAGARVTVDGRAAGLSPLSVSLTPGTHYLSVERTGYHRFTDRVVVDGEGLSAPLVVVLQRATVDELRAQASAPEGLPEAPDGETLLGMARAYGLDRAVFVGRDGRAVHVPDRRAPTPPPRSAWPWVLGSIGGALVAGAAVIGLIELAGADSAAPTPRLTLVLGF